jgi:type IV secretory pathway VirB10-like protein
VKLIRIATIFLWTALVCLAACETLFISSHPTPTAEITPTPGPTATPTPAPTATPELKKRRRRRRGRTPTPLLSPTPTSEQTPAAAATVITTGETAAERNEVEKGLKQIEQRLAPVDRSKLNPQDSEDYDRIKSFVTEARSALQEQDALRARSLLEKATRLTTELTGRISSP